jgi:RNA polymerase sigma-70 factor (ECF subfamily)
MGLHRHDLIAPEAALAAASHSAHYLRDTSKPPASQPATIIEFPVPVAPSPKRATPAHRKLEALYRDHHEQLVRFLRLRLGSRADADEVAQEAYLRLMQVSDAQHPKAYLYKVASNAANDLLRRRRCARNAQEQSSDEERIEATQERIVAARQQLQIAQQALQELSPPCREAFELHRQQGWSTLRIAGHLGVTDRTARRYLIRALRHVQEALDGAPDWGYHCG